MNGERGKDLAHDGLTWKDVEGEDAPPEYYADDVLFDHLDRYIDLNSTGGDVYEQLTRVFRWPSAASEFLAEAGIDGVKYPADSYGGKGVKDGDVAGWNYVSFRDDNVRVDHKWTDGKMRYSISPSEDAAEQERREYDEVVARYTNRDGTPKRGWMKAPNGKPTKLTERQWVQVRTPSFKKWFGDWEAAAKLSTIERMTPIEIKDLADGFDAKATYSSLENGKNALDGREVRFVNATLGKILRHKGYDMARLVPRLKEVFDAAIPLGFETERTMPARGDGTKHKEHRNFVGYHNYLGKIADGGRMYFVRFTVQELKTRSKSFVPNELHSTFVSDVELYNEADLLALDTAKGAGKVGAVGLTDGILAKTISEFKRAIDGLSKVVDENGEPMVVYHATDNAFTVFDRSRLGENTDSNAGDEAARQMARLGFWFNERDLHSRISAKRAIAAYVDIKNPYNTTFNELWDILSEITHEEFIKDLNEKGYDGIVLEDAEFGGTSFVMFEPPQIKSATDNTGAFDANNPDIRFSIARTKAGKTFALLDRPVDIDWNDRDSVRDYLATLIGTGAVSLADGKRIRIGADLPKEYTRSNYAQKAFRNVRLRKLRGKSAQHIDELIVASGVRDAEEARHRKRHGGVYYRRTVDIGVKGHEKSRGYSADMLTYIQGGEEYLYDIVRIRENPSLVSALAAEGNGGYEILSTKSDGEGNVPHGTQRIVPQGGRGAQGGGLRPSIRRQSEAADAALRAVEGSAVVQGDPLEAHSRNLMKDNASVFSVNSRRAHSSLIVDM